MPIRSRNPIPQVSRERWLSLVIFLLAVFFRLIPGARTIDDAFITYRYARNLIAGDGFVFNPGERVLGTTTPLYTILMVGLGSISGGAQAPFPNLALIINALADGVTCLLLIWLGRRLGFRFAGFGAAVCWAVAPYSVTFAIGGLETSVFVMLLVGCAAAHLAERRILAAFTGALALLTRPDALILIGPLALDRILQWRNESRRGDFNLRNTVKEALAFAVPTLGWILFASAYFGSPLPHSILAKSVAYRLDSEAGLVRLLQHYSTPFMENLTFGAGWIRIGLVIVLFFFIVGGLRGFRQEKHVWPLMVYPWLYLVIFAAANPLIFRWYLTPPLPALFLFILGGIERIILDIWDWLQGRLHSGADHSAVPSWLNMIFLILIPALLLLRGWRIHPDHGIDRPAPDMAWDRLELLYYQAADILNQRLAAGPNLSPTLAAGDVGVLGFFTGLPLLDTVGLNSPISTRYYPIDKAYYTINYAVPPQLILDVKPDYIVILEVYGRNGLLKQPEFWEQYRLLQTLPTDMYGSDGMLILEKAAP